MCRQFLPCSPNLPRQINGQNPRSGPCQSRPERVAKALFATFPNQSRMHRAVSPGCHAKNAPVAQLDRALDYESRGQEFESLRARHFATIQNKTANSDKGLRADLASMYSM